MATEDGWEPSPRIAPNDPLLVWRNVPGSDVTIQVRNDNAGTAMLAYAADYHAFVEPLVNSMTACYTPTNSVDTSNHLNATAMDFNWEFYPWKQRGNLNGDKLARLRDMLAYWQGIMFWAGDWDDAYVDEMHHQMDYGSYDLERSGQLGQWIKDHIRADGFSTYRRGGTAAPPVIVEPPVPASNAADILARATDITLAKATSVLPLVSFALSKGNCTNPRRIAAALAQWVIESGHFVYTEEIADGPEDQERWKYKGRTWIQLTWLENYLGFSQWCYSLGLVPSPTYFGDNPHELADQKWAALGPAYWWAIKYPRINEYADRGDIDNVSKWVNAPAWVDNPNRHANSEQERRDAYNLALALGDQLLALTTAAPPTTGDDLSAEDIARIEGKLDILLGEVGPNKLGPSRSFCATDGAPVDSPLGFIYNIDGNVWTQQLTWAYLFDVPLALEVVESVAQNGSYQGSWVQANAQSFNKWLNEFGQAYCQGLVSFKRALVSKLALSAQSVGGVAPANVTNVVDTRALEAEISRLTAQFGQLQSAINNQPAPYVPPVATEVAVHEDSTGDKIQRAVDSNMDYTAHVLAMDAAERNGLTRALNSINPSNGDKA